MSGEILRALRRAGDIIHSEENVNRWTIHAGQAELLRMIDQRSESAPPLLLHMFDYLEASESLLSSAWSAQEEV